MEDRRDPNHRRAVFPGQQGDRAGIDAAGDVRGDRTPEVLAHRWVRDVFRPTVRAVPPEMRGSMDPAEIYHELLEHRWYLSERAQHDIGLDTAVEPDVVLGPLRDLPRAA